jgi:hypothetical protein
VVLPVPEAGVCWLGSPPRLLDDPDEAHRKMFLDVEVDAARDAVCTKPDDLNMLYIFIMRLPAPLMTKVRLRGRGMRCQGKDDLSSIIIACRTGRFQAAL